MYPRRVCLRDLIRSSYHTNILHSVTFQFFRIIKNHRVPVGYHRHTMTADVTAPTLWRWLKSNINSSPPEQNGRHSADDIFKCISMKNPCILIRISLKFVSKGPINNKPELVQVMAWLRPGGKPLPDPILTQFTDAYMRHQGEMSWCDRMGIIRARAKSNVYLFKVMNGAIMTVNSHV